MGKTWRRVDKAEKGIRGEYDRVRFDDDPYKNMSRSNIHTALNHSSFDDDEDDYDDEGSYWSSQE